MVIILAVIAMLLMTIAYMLPTQRMKQHMVESKELLYELNDDYNSTSNQRAFEYDTKTNMITLGEVIAPRMENFLKDALSSPSINYLKIFSGDWVSMLIDYSQTEQYASDDFITYSRYWHGYVLFLKPLFLFFDLEQVYQIHTVILTWVGLVVLWLIYKNAKAYSVPYLILMGLFNPIYIARSFQLSSVFISMQITLMLILYCSKEELQEKGLMYIFALDGIMLAFLDFLTYPAVAFAIPLTFVVALSKKNFFEDIVLCIRVGISFLLGYAGMWGCKWILASVFTGENVIQDGINSVMHRTGTGDNFAADDYFGVDISVRTSLRANLTAFLNPPVVVTLILIIIFIIVMAIYKQNIYLLMEKRSLEKLMIYAMIAMIAIAWLVVLYNHCSLHPHLEWREWLIPVYAGLMWVFGMLGKDSSKGEKVDE